MPCVAFTVCPYHIWVLATSLSSLYYLHHPTLMVPQHETFTLSEIKYRTAFFLFYGILDGALRIEKMFSKTIEYLFY